MPSLCRSLPFPSRLRNRGTHPHPRLQASVLAKAGSLRTAGWSFEPTWDGFRAIIHDGGRHSVPSRRLPRVAARFSAAPTASRRCDHWTREARARCRFRRPGLGSSGSLGHPVSRSEDAT